MIAIREAETTEPAEPAEPAEPDAPAARADLAACAALSATYQTSEAWQVVPAGEAPWQASTVPRPVQTGSMPSLSFQLQRVRLPRTRTVKLPWEIVPLADTWAGYALRLIAEMDDELCGYLCVQTVADQQHAVIARLLVAPDQRRKGVGTALVRALRAWSRYEGLVSLRAHVPLRNVPGLTFYQRCGFRISGFAAHYYPTNEDALLLSQKVA